MSNCDGIKKHCEPVRNTCTCSDCKYEKLKKKYKKNKREIIKLKKEIKIINNTLKYISIDENDVVNIGYPNILCGLKVYGPMTNIPI